MTRAVAEWIGKHDNEAIPPRVMLRVYTKFNGVCPKCNRILQRGKWACDHVIALVNGGKHAESNLQPLCVSPCHSQKTAEDVAEKSRNYRKRAKHIGAFAPRQKMRSAPFRKSAPQRTASRPLIRHGEG